MNWNASAGRVEWKIHPFINGAYRASGSREYFDNINPATERVLCRVAVGSIDDIDEAVRVARRRFNDGSWSELPPFRRAEVLFKFADLIVEHKAELALLDSLEMGKPISAALVDTRDLAPMLLRTWAGLADKLLGESAPLRSAGVSFNTYEPRGVIGAITAWNFPAVNAIFKLGPALAAGNSIVLKPSELCASSALRIAELALEAGVPEGVLNVVPGLGKVVGDALARHPDVDMISFTGSTATGRRIMEASGGSNGKPLLLECGGKCPQIVFDDAVDLDLVSEAVARGILSNQGQVCSAHSRLIVHESIKQPLLEKVVARARGCTFGDPLDEATTYGPLSSAAHRDRVKAFVDRGLEEGATAVLKGEIRGQGGCYVAPTVFDNVHGGMSIVRDEIFGPVLCVQQFTTETEAIALANQTEYGLAATVWTCDAGRGRRLAHMIRAGAVSVRTGRKEALQSGCALSFEPQKASGFGSEIGLRGLQSYSTLKLVSMYGD